MVAGIVLISLAVILGLIMTVLHIMIIVKVFKHAGVGLGILAIFCSPFPFIWGWIKSGELGLKKTMVWYTILLVLAVILYAGGSVAMISSPEAQRAMEEQRIQQQQQQQQQQTLPAPQN